MGISSSTANPEEETLETLYNSAQQIEKWNCSIPSKKNKQIEYNLDLPIAKLEDVFMLKSSNLLLLIDNLHKVFAPQENDIGYNLKDYGSFFIHPVGVYSKKLEKHLVTAIRIKFVYVDQEYFIFLPLNSDIGRNKTFYYWFCGDKYNRYKINTTLKYDFISPFPHIDYTFNPDELCEMLINYIQRTSQVPYRFEITGNQYQSIPVEREMIVFPSNQRNYEIANNYPKHAFIIDNKTLEPTETIQIELEELVFEHESNELIRKRN